MADVWEDDWTTRKARRVSWCKSFYVKYVDPETRSPRSVEVDLIEEEEQKLAFVRALASMHTPGIVTRKHL